MSESNRPLFQEATYINPGLPEYAENPLIAALPEIMSPRDASKILTQRPTFNPEEVKLKGHIRAHAISRLTRNFFVPQTTHLLLEQKISQLIRKSYLGRNPKTATFKRKLNTVRDIIQSQDLTAYIHDDSNSTASSMAISGISGAGKTSATDIILNTYEKVIYHPDFNLLQVPWIKIDCPYDGALSEFCESFFIALDKRLNTTYRQKYTTGKPSIGKMIANVADLCLVHAIGLIVVDEFQHMNLAKSGGEKKMINFLVTLVNVVEVSVVLIGTPKALRLFSSEFRQARRASGEGSIVWDRLQLDESWDFFLSELFQYQWLKFPTQLDERLINKLYELSQGVPDIVVKLFCVAQAKAILLAAEPEDEQLSIELLDDVFDEEFSIVKPMLDALRINDKNALETCSDIVIPKIETALMNNFDHLKPVSLNRSRKLELGDSSQTEIANSAIDTLLAMGISQDIAKPLVNDCLRNNPEVTLIQIIHEVTCSFSDNFKSPSNKSKKQNTLVKRSAWGQLESSDLRKLHADRKSSMYEALHGNDYIYPVALHLAS